MTRAAVIAILWGLPLTLGCTREDPNEGKLMPRLAPPPDNSAPANLRIPVSIGDKELPPIDSAVLDKRPPDFSDEQRAAWRLDSLIDKGQIPAGAAFAVTSARGVKTELPTEVQGEVPALVLSRRGEIVIELVDPTTPFPRFHGQGGRLGRSPGNRPRIVDPARIQVISVTPDGGGADGGSAEGGSAEGGGTDGGSADGGTTDGGTPSGGAPDAGARP